MINFLNLDKNKYDSISKIIELFDIFLDNKKMKIHIDKTKNYMALYLTIKENSKEEEYCIYLEYQIMTDRNMLNVLIEEINGIKNNTLEIDKCNNIKELENKIMEIDDNITK